MVLAFMKKERRRRRERPFSLDNEDDGGGGGAAFSKFNSGRSKTFNKGESEMARERGREGRGAAIRASFKYQARTGSDSRHNMSENQGIPFITCFMFP